MIRHLFKLVWNRKRTNGLIILEIFLAFLVCFVVVSIGVANVSLYGRPLGFHYDNVWYVTLDTGNDYDWMVEQAPNLDRVLRELESVDGVLAAAASQGLPYDGNQSIWSFQVDGREGRTELLPITPGFLDVFGLELVDGRWLDQTDLGQNWTAVVIDRDLAREAFGDESPLGRPMPMDSRTEFRVVGVVSDFRKSGEFAPPGNFLFQLAHPQSQGLVPLSSFALRLHPSVTAQLEEELVRRVRAVAPEWTVEVTDLEQKRRADLRLRMAPMIAGALVAVFLLVMVGLGLIGVLWQNVTQRTREIGLRRATGAHRGHIQLQILTELLLMTTIGVGAGILVAVQLPVLELWGLITPGVFVLGILLSLAAMYVLALACGLYPSWLATRVQPAEALHYE